MEGDLVCPDEASMHAGRDTHFNMDLLLSNDTQQRLDKISQVNHYPVGLELELQVRSSQYLLDQVMYSRELSDTRICRITSSLLSSKSLTK